MEFKEGEGIKGKEDKVLFIKTDGYEKLTYRDLFKMIKFFFENEDRIYPSPAKGGRFLLDAITSLRNMSVDEVLLKYRAKTAEYLHEFI